MFERFDWLVIEKALIVRAVITSFVIVIVFGSGFVFAQQVQASEESGKTMSGQFFSGATTDPWFWVVVLAWLFSCVVQGMPEPDRESSPWYLWAYRSLRLMSASGTSYFQHRNMWPEMKTKVVPIEPDHDVLTIQRDTQVSVESGKPSQ